MTDTFHLSTAKGVEMRQDARIDSARFWANLALNKICQSTSSSMLQSRKKYEGCAAKRTPHIHTVYLFASQSAHTACHKAPTLRNQQHLALGLPPFQIGMGSGGIA
ncbi:MAG: hypothetical protein KDE47_20075, partial [Caldilineaceae bacterium]|nr:hypothetical protein [Caldilineaceae bacterium]